MQEKDKNKKRIGVIRGGEGRNYHRSLKRGGEIISHIFENLGEKYSVHDILIDKAGIWHFRGLPITPAELMQKVDVVLNTAHPGAGVVLDNLSIPNITRSHFSMALEGNRNLLKEHLKDTEIKIPRHLVLPLYQKDFDGPVSEYAMKKAKEVFEKFSGPWIVRSYSEDANMGVHLAKTFPELADAIEDGVKHKDSILVEEFIIGKAASVHSLANFRGEDVYTFPLASASSGLTAAEKNKFETLAKILHKHIGVTHYLKSDFILTSRGKMYLTEIETLPDVRADSHFAQACESVGAKMDHVIEHILNQA